MSEAEASDQSGGELVPRQPSLLRSSLIMASGTLLSRLLGFLRNAMLIAAIGVSLGVADAFGSANTLPNSVYNLLAAGIFDAILIPQIVRALKQKNGTVYVNRLLTAAGTILFGITVLAMIGAPLLITITSSGFPPQVRTLAITFALWCLPQIFFYGLYNLLGEVLNARGIFGPYMWAPVVNNIIAIAGLGVFLYLWGPSGEVFPADEFTRNQLYVLAGSATLGVILQAFVLLIPLRGSGVKLRPDFRFRETNFGSASKVAGWTFATLLVSQLGVLSTTNLASRAVAWAEDMGTVVPTLPAYNTAFMIYMVPQSLIALTLATAIFTRLANNVSDGDYVAVARNYTLGVRMIVLLSMLSVAIIMVGAIPMMQLIMPTFHAEQASLYALVVVALIMGVPSTGIVMISQRVFFAFENAKPVFLMGIVPTALQLIIGWTIYFTMSGEWWTVGAALAETVCRVLQGFIAIFWTAYLVRTINAGRLIAYYLRYFIAFAISALVGWGFLHLVGPGSFSDSMTARFTEAFWKLALTATIITVVYFLVLHFVDRTGTTMLRQYLGERVPARFRPSFLAVQPSSQVNEENDEDVASNSDEAVLDTAVKAMTTQLPLGSIINVGQAGDSCAAFTLPTPTWDEIITGELASRSVTRSLGGMPDLPTGQVPIVFPASAEPHSPHTPEGILLKDETSESEPVGEGPSGDEIPDETDTPLPGQAITTPVGGVVPPTARKIEDFDALLVDDEPTAEAFPDDPAIPSDVHYAQVSPESAVKSPSTTGTRFKIKEAPKLLSFASLPGTAAKANAKAKTLRFDPTVPALILGVLAVVFALFFAIGQIRKPVEFSLDGFPVSGSEQSGEQSGPGEVTETPTEEAPPPAETLAPPVISSIWVSSWNDDGFDHPELVDMLVDGNPETLWYTRYYDVNEFSEESMISLLVNLEAEALVSEITLDVHGSGGEVIIRNPEGEDPRKGAVLATSSTDGLTTIKLAQPTKMSRVGINFLKLPTDYEGLNRAQIAELTIK